VQKQLSSGSDSRQPGSEQTQSCWLEAPACSVVEPGGHCVQLVSPIVGV
jgi:hypothetical protein